MNNLILAFSFLTNIRMPQVEFNKKNYKYLPLLFLIVGIVIGLLGYGLVYLLNITNFSSILKAVLITIYFAYITGGLHLDGLLDTVDSFLSRRDLEERLRIMHDSNIGAFACIFAILFFILKIVVVRDLIVTNSTYLYIIYIPIISRLFAALMISSAKFATDKGLASMYKDTVESWFKYIILLQLVIVGITFIFFDFNILFIIIAMFIYFGLYLRFMYKHYKGITGDILGAFVETSELLMLFIYLGVII